MRCEKRRYRTEVDAKIALSKLLRQDKPDHTERRAYSCPKCHGWHLTSRAMKGAQS